MTILSALSTRSANWDNYSDRRISITASDVIAACKALPIRSYVFAMYVYYGDKSRWKLLLQYLRNDIRSLWNQNNWRLNNVDPVLSAVSKSNQCEKSIINQRFMCTRLAITAIHDIKYRGLHSKCRGKGKYHGLICQGCNGLGYKSIQNSQIITDLGISESSFNKTWGKRYKKSRSILQGYEINLDKILRKQLF